MLSTQAFQNYGVAHHSYVRLASQQDRLWGLENILCTEVRHSTHQMSTHSCCYPLLSRTLDETLFLPVMMGSTQHCYVSTYTLARSNHIPPINVFMSPLVAPGRTWKDKPRNVFLLNNEIMAKVLVAHSLSSSEDAMYVHSDLLVISPASMFHFPRRWNVLFGQKFTLYDARTFTRAQRRSWCLNSTLISLSLISPNILRWKSLWNAAWNWDCE